MPADITAWFREHRAGQAVVPIGDGLVFAAAGGGPVHPETSRKALAAICTRIGIHAALPNESRHSCAAC